jgi:hypothetical protein
MWQNNLTSWNISWHITNYHSPLAIYLIIWSTNLMVDSKCTFKLSQTMHTQMKTFKLPCIETNSNSWCYIEFIQHKLHQNIPFKFQEYLVMWNLTLGTRTQICNFVSNNKKHSKLKTIIVICKMETPQRHYNVVHQTHNPSILNQNYNLQLGNFSKNTPM